MSNEHRMKSQRATLKILAAAALLCASGLSSAGDNTTLNVTATVAGICKFSAASQNVTIALDPSTGSNATGSWAVPYRCTKGTTSGGVTVDTTSRTLTADAPANGTIAYSIVLAGGTQVGDGFGAAAASRDLTVSYTVTNAAFADKAVDTYRDTITLSITP